MQIFLYFSDFFIFFGFSYKMQLTKNANYMQCKSKKFSPTLKFNIVLNVTNKNKNKRENFSTKINYCCGGG